MRECQAPDGGIEARARAQGRCLRQLRRRSSVSVGFCSYRSYMDNFERVLGQGRGSKQRRDEHSLEEEIVEIVYKRAPNGGVTSSALIGAVRREQSLVEAALAATESEGRIQRCPKGRWYPAVPCR